LGVRLHHFGGVRLDLFGERISEIRWLNDLGECGVRIAEATGSLNAGLRCGERI